MRYVDLVLNCIKETLHNDDITLTVDNIREGKVAANSDYANLCFNVSLSINKAIARLITAEKIPYKHTILTPDASSDIYDISHITDIRKIRSIYTIDNGRPNWIGWFEIMPGYLYLGYGLDSTIHFVYERKIPDFTEADIDSEDDLDEKYGLSNELCNYISYFAKSEMFEEIDPDRCKRYLNYFEQFVSEINKREQIPYQTGVKARFKI